MQQLNRFMSRFGRDLALTMYDHPTEFICMSLARVGAWYFGALIGITWYQELFHGIKFANWMYLTTAFTACLTAYGLKKWQDGKIETVKQQYNSQEANMKP